MGLGTFAVGESAGASGTARAFDATISTTAVDRALYLVVGAGQVPTLAVREVGGTVATDLGGQRALAVLPYSGFTRLRTDHRIKLVGPVTMDAARFSGFLRMLGLDSR